MLDNSHKTAIGRNKLSSPMQWLKDNNLLRGKILDFGCGRGTDADFLRSDGYDVNKYDPHYFKMKLESDAYDTVTCHYVLNTIPYELNRLRVIMSIINCLKPGCTAYITVRRDIKKDGWTSKGTYQENIKLNSDNIIKETRGYCIYKIYLPTEEEVNGQQVKK